jgi:putative membrane protein
MIYFLLALVLQSLVVIYLFPWINPQFKVLGDPLNSIWVVLAFLLINWIIRKLLIIFTLGIGWLVYYLSLGFLRLVVNAFVLILIGKFFPNLLSVPGFWAAFWGGLLLTLASLVMKKDSKD